MSARVPVNIELRQADKLLGTNAARVRAFSRVYAHMVLDVVRVIRPKSADPARERRRAEMKSHVTDEVVAACDPFAAHVARERLLVAVLVQVRFQFGKSRKCFAAHAAGVKALVWRDLGCTPGSVVVYGTMFLTTVA